MTDTAEPDNNDDDIHLVEPEGAYDGSEQEPDPEEENDDEKEGEESKESGGSDSNKPDRKKDKEKDKSENIMDLMWNQWIIGPYKAVLDWTTDLFLDICDYIFFDTYFPKTQKKKKKERKEKGVWAICAELRKEYETKASNDYACFKKAHEELMTNVDNAKKGVATAWAFWPNKKAPAFFDRIVEISKKAEQDPNSPEAKQWAQLTSLPRTMEYFFKKQVFHRWAALNMATMEVAVSKEKYKLPEEVSRTIKTMAEISVDPKDENAYVAHMNAQITEIRKHINTGTEVDNAIALQLQEMERALNDPTKKLNEKTKSISKNIKSIEHINYTVLKEKINKKSQGYYDEMLKNIEKIKENAGSREEGERAIREYRTSIAKKIQENRRIVKGYADSRFSDFFDNLRQRMNDFLEQEPEPGNPEQPTSRQVAEDAFKETVGTISNFKVKGKEISTYGEPKNKPFDPFRREGGGVPNFFKYYKVHTH